MSLFELLSSYDNLQPFLGLQIHLINDIYTAIKIIQNLIRLYKIRFLEHANLVTELDRQFLQLTGLIKGLDILDDGNSLDDAYRKSLKAKMVFLTSELEGIETNLKRFLDRMGVGFERKFDEKLLSSSETTKTKLVKFRSGLNFIIAGRVQLENTLAVTNKWIDDLWNECMILAASDIHEVAMRDSDQDFNPIYKPKDKRTYYESFKHLNLDILIPIPISVSIQPTQIPILAFLKRIMTARQNAKTLDLLTLDELRQKAFNPLIIPESAVVYKRDVKILEEDSDREFGKMLEIIKDDYEEENFEANGGSAGGRRLGNCVIDGRGYLYGPPFEQMFRETLFVAALLSEGLDFGVVGERVRNRPPPRVDDDDDDDDDEEDDEKVKKEEKEKDVSGTGSETGAANAVVTETATDNNNNDNDVDNTPPKPMQNASDPLKSNQSQLQSQSRPTTYNRTSLIPKCIGVIPRLRLYPQRFDLLFELPAHIDPSSIRSLRAALCESYESRVVKKDEEVKKKANTEVKMRGAGGDSNADGSIEGYKEKEENELEEFEIDTVTDTDTLTTHPVEERYKLALLLSQELFLIHAAGLIHRQVRPESIILGDIYPTSTSSSINSNKGSDNAKSDKKLNHLGHPSLLGFGQTRTDEGITKRTTFTTHPLRTLIYRSPRHQGFPGTRPDRFRTIDDIYALGVVLLEIGLWESLFVPEERVSRYGERERYFVENIKFLEWESVRRREKEGFRMFCERGEDATSTSISVLSPSNEEGLGLEYQKALLDKARNCLPAKVGYAYTSVVIACLDCYNPHNIAGFGFGDGFAENEGDAVDENDDANLNANDNESGNENNDEDEDKAVEEKMERAMIGMRSGTNILNVKPGKLLRKFERVVLARLRRLVGGEIDS